jgi:NitT/TauT family transport system permease protein
MNPVVLLSGFGVLAGLVGLWELAEHLFPIPAYLVPPPSAIFAEFITNRALYATQTAVTVEATLIGFATASVLGILVGCVTAYSWLFRSTLYPTLLLLQVVPKVAIAPLLIIFLGYGLEFKIVVIATIAFFPVVINTVLGLTSVEPDLVMLARVLCASRLKEFLKVGLPHSAPSILSGMKVAMTLSVIGAVVAEFVSSDSGLGYTLLIANAQFNTAMAFVALTLLSLLGFVLYFALEAIEAWALPWADSQQDTLTFMG